MDVDTETLLVSTCLALGGFEDQSEDVNDSQQVYVMGDECLECLKDIKKFIKYYEEPADNVVLTYLGTLGILQKDLIPIMLLNTPADTSAKERLVLACMELIVPMTWIIDYDALRDLANNEEDSSIVGNLHERTETLRGYKKAFLQPGVLSAVFQVLLKPLQVEYRMRTTRDQAVIRLGMSLFRNLVAIQDTESSITGTMDQFLSSVMQEELLERFQQENVTALLLTLASSSEKPQFQEWDGMTLEIFYHIFTGIDPDELMPAVSGGGKNSQLADLLGKEEKARSMQSSAGRKRHDRFGTTGEVRLQDGTRMVLHRKGALFASFENQLDEIKKPRAQNRRIKDTGDNKKNITKAGAILLRNLALTLLEGGIGPLLVTIRRDMESEKDRIKPYHRSQYLYLLAFFLKFQRQYTDYLTRQFMEQRRKFLEQQDKFPERKQTQTLESMEADYEKSILQCDFDLLARSMEVPCVFQVITIMRAMSEEKKWEQVRGAMNCFQEILMTLYAMSKASEDDYREAADNIQNNLYHEDATLELFLHLLKTYKTQSTKYLNTLIRMVHILMKTLESYSKSKPDMFVRKKRAIAKRKSKKAKEAEADQAGEPGNGAPASGEPTTENGTLDTLGDQPEAVEEEGSEGENDEQKIRHEMRERRFVFRDYERRFACEQVIQTYCTFLEDYAQLDETQLHWAASMFHRIAVNCANNAVFFKLSTLQLFHQILQNGKDDTRRDLVPFVSYIVHQFFKKLQEYPVLIAELMFPRSSKACFEINVGRDAVDEKEEAISKKKEKKLMETELQVDPERSETEQIQIAVLALVAEDKEDLVEWAIELLRDAVEKRTLMAFHTEAELAENPDLVYSAGNVDDIYVVPGTPARTSALRVEPRFRLLLKLAQFTRETDSLNGDFKYKLGKDVPTDTIAEYEALIQKTLEEEFHQDHNYNFDELIKKMSKPRTSSGKKRSGLGRERMEKEMAVYRTAEYVVDSDMDSDEDEMYFARERKLRERNKEVFTKAEREHRAKEEQNAKSKSLKAKALAAERAKKMVSLTDDEAEDEMNSIFGFRRDKGEEALESMRTYGSNERRALTDDSDIDQGGESDQSDESVEDKAGPFLSVAGPVDDSDEELDRSRMSLTQRLSAQTNKRRIILDDSDQDEEMGSDRSSPESDSSSSVQRPPQKKFAFEE